MKNPTPITTEKAAELMEYGQRINVKVTPTYIGGVPYVNIRNSQMNDFVRAALYLRHIEMTEIPESVNYLVA